MLFRKRGWLQVTNLMIFFARPPNASLATHMTISINNEAIYVVDTDPNTSPIPSFKSAGCCQIP